MKKKWSLHLSVLAKFLIVFTFSNANASVIDYDARWPDGKITVCFASPKMRDRSDLRQQAGIYTPTLVEWSEIEKLEIQSWIDDAFRSESMSLVISGWSDCNGNESPATVYIFRFDKMPFEEGFVEGFGRIGKRVGPARNDFGEATYQALALASLSGTAHKGNVLHEFGHLCGLRHEHIRSEARQDPKCDQETIDRASRESQVLLMIGDYDSDSIMSYCYLRTTSDPKLSEGDYRALRFLYPK